MDKSQQQMLLKPPQRIRLKKTAEATGYLAVNKIVEHVTKTVTNNNREDSKKIYNRTNITTSECT